MSSIYYKGQKYTGPTLDLGSGSLTTDNKTIVGAINELDGKVDGSSLTTDNKTIVGAINELDTRMDALTPLMGTLDTSHLADAGITDNGSRIYRYGKMVMLIVNLKSNTSGTAQSTGIWIPEGYRPLTSTPFIAGDGGTTGQSVGTISTFGSVNVYFGSTKYAQTVVCYLTA